MEDAIVICDAGIGLANGPPEGFWAAGRESPLFRKHWRLVCLFGGAGYG